MHCRSMHQQLHQLRSRRKCQTRLVQELLAACRDTTKTMVWLYSSTLENPKFGRQNTHRAWSWNVWVSFLCVGCPRTAEQELWITLFFCASFTCRSEVHCMDLICHWGQQEDLESPQVARLPQKSLVKVPKFYEFSPCKWWNQWNQMQHGSDEITFILLNRLNVFYLLRFVFFDPYQLWLDHLDFMSFLEP